MSRDQSSNGPRVSRRDFVQGSLAAASAPLLAAAARADAAPQVGGAMRNIATFHESVTSGCFDNPTVQRAVDGCLTCILGREAAARQGRLSMDELIKEDRRIEVDRTGLKA
ncbi:MAG: hypothetical protein ABSG68_03995 [Thermoguttaceae bacterium]|jgi:hypothetical protein